MAIELPQEVTQRLTTDHFGWLTTVANSGQPVPRLVWFYFDGADVTLYTEPGAAKVRHIRNHPRVSLNLDSDGQVIAQAQDYECVIDRQLDQAFRKNQLAPSVGS